MSKTAWSPVGTTKRIDAADLRKLLTKVAVQQTAQPRLVGDGPSEFSTCTSLEPSPRFVWDTNGFYRSLGVATDATRGEMARAYLARDGHSSVRLTHILTTLLDPYLRSRYDATPLGMLWADDDALQHRITNYDDGMEIVTVGTTPWSIYVLGIRDELIDHELIDAWRAAVVDACMRLGIVRNLAVGLCSNEFDPHVRAVGQRLAIFLPIGVATKAALDYSAYRVATGLTAWGNDGS